MNVCMYVGLFEVHKSCELLELYIKIRLVGVALPNKSKLIILEYLENYNCVSP